LGPLGTGCIAQVTGTGDSVLLARLMDSTLWVARGSSDFAPVLGSTGEQVRGSGSAASGSSATGTAIGCAIADTVRCFPLAGALRDSTGLGAGLDPTASPESSQLVLGRRGSDIEPLRNVTQIAGGTGSAGATFCAVTGDGHVWCWGYNPDGLLGRGAGDDSSYAQPVLADANTELTFAVEVSVGFDSACARSSDGGVHCWGNDAHGQLGTLPSPTGSEGSFSALVSLPGAATRLAASPGTTQCAILNDARVACWGQNGAARAGAESELLNVPPTIVMTAPGGPAFGAVLDVAPDRGTRATCANTKNAGLWCWGDVLADDPNELGSPYPIQLATSPQGRISVPLSAYGADAGKLVFVNANGRLVLGAGNMPSPQQPPCP
jgi:hypothetical protein